MALHLHRASRLRLLADGLGALLATPPSDPFANELVLVPARGVERWLSQRLSHILGSASGSAEGSMPGDGVCAAVSFRSPRSLIAEFLGVGADDPWSPEVMTWPLLAAIDDVLDEPWARPLAIHLGHLNGPGDRRRSADEPALSGADSFRDTGPADQELRRGRRYAVARRLAGLFDRYARERPGLLTSWLAGEVGDLPDDLAWQPPLWRALVARRDIPPPDLRHRDTVARLTAALAMLPDRLSLFGHTRLAATDIDLLRAAANHHDVHLWLPHPSDALWRSLADLHPAVPRSADSSHRLVRHPLLATLGRDLREFQRSLPRNPAIDEVLLGGPGDRPETLLSWLQSDLAADAVRPKDRALSVGDRSVQVHSCHSAARQVEVLREVLLGLLADDTTLQPRDIVVLCPKIEVYAPLLVAAFGPADALPGTHPGHRLRVQIADHSPMQTNPLLAVTSKLLTLPGGREAATEVLDIARSAPVRACFDFDDEDLATVTTWVRDSRIRWGFDAEHRESYGVDFAENTWQSGMDRILAGVAMSESSHSWIEQTLPLDDVPNSEAELAGRFAEFIDRLRRVADSLTGTRPLDDWLSALSHGLAQLTRVAADDIWQLNEIQGEFAAIRRCAGPLSTTTLRLPDICALLEQRLEGRPGRADFGTGALTVCSLAPMRSVPHRVVCLVGLDDGVFPRAGNVDGDDALARRPFTGDRDVRSEDRQLLLDAICAASDTVVITYTGASEHTGQHRPPAVPLAELLDALARTCNGDALSRIVVEHPLQPFDARNFEAGALVPGIPFSFDQTALVAARTAMGSRHERPPFVGDLLPAPPTGDVALSDLIAFFKDPVKGFFQALNVTLPSDIDDVEDAMPIELTPLQHWQVGDRILTDLRAGATLDQAAAAEARRGTIPPGQIGSRLLADIASQAAQVAELASSYTSDAKGVAINPSAYDIDIDLGGRRLTGTVSPVYGDHLVEVMYSKLEGKHLLKGWIPLLALLADTPDRQWSAVRVGRAPDNTAPVKRVLHRPADNPVDLLRDLVAIYDVGQREPIPLPLKTSYAWATARDSGKNPVGPATQAWTSTYSRTGEDAQPAHAKAWGPDAELDVLRQPLPVGEQHLAGTPPEDNRLGAFAVRLWSPLLSAEQSGF